MAVTMSLPEFAPIVGEMAWKSAELADGRAWIHHLRLDEIAELEDAAARAADEDRPLAGITASNFPLPLLQERLLGLRGTLRQGCGVVLLKGLDPARLPAGRLHHVLMGLGAHLGTPVTQSFRGDYIGMVTDHGEPGNERPYRRGGEISFHRDPCDIVGLLCDRKAKIGGASRIVAAASIWNALLEEDPALLAPLMEGFVLFRTRDDRTVATLVTDRRIPVFGRDCDGLLHCTFIPGLAEAAARLEGGDLPDEAQRAIERFRAISCREDLCLEMQIEEGDIQLLNNRTTLHSRSDYEDWPEQERRRMMLRLWLMCRDWPQPEWSVSRHFLSEVPIWMA